MRREPTKDTTLDMSKGASTPLASLERSWGKTGMAARQQFEWLLDYELRAATRYRRFASLVFLGSYDGNVDLKALLASALRGSDEFFAFDPAAAVLMGDTDKEQAMGAITRYKSVAAGVDLRFGVVTFPLDARHPADLHATGMTRLDVARRGGYGDIVDVGKSLHDEPAGEERR